VFKSMNAAETEIFDFVNPITKDLTLEHKESGMSSLS